MMYQQTLATTTSLYFLRMWMESQKFLLVDGVVAQGLLNTRIKKFNPLLFSILWCTLAHYN